MNRRQAPHWKLAQHLALTGPWSQLHQCPAADSYVFEFDHIRAYPDCSALTLHRYARDVGVQKTVQCRFQGSSLHVCG
ncbi:hypothetical protein WJX73_006833 [Symbiochloris irregularis]|uniref:Uncharacterized protein n=1 Tax=Symbiochloris irregularis TaxID=706552 RepID=A0AAW1NWB7_9CHLO